MLSQMRPKKPRFIDGIQLADNLYPDCKGRPGRYRYKRADGTLKGFAADSVEVANRIANEANHAREHAPAEPKQAPIREQLKYHALEYIRYQETINPALTAKRSWENRKYAIHQLCDRFPLLRDLSHESLRGFWDCLTYNQQKLRMSAFRAFFNWLMGQALTPKLTFNPFTTADDKPRLLLKQKPPKQRNPITQSEFNEIHAAAASLGYEALQIAMDISRYTTLREGDICALQWSDIENGVLKVVVHKSIAQKGSARATRHQWTLADHPILKRSIDAARVLSLKNKRCPFILSHKPKRRVWNDAKTHLYQVTPDRLSRMFAEARNAAGIQNTSFHEVRGLSATLFRKAGYSNSDIQNLMAHESIATTIGYQNANDLPYSEVTLKLEK